MAKGSYAEVLRKKGWHEAEIKHALHSLETVTEHDIHFSKIVFYSALLLIVFANVFVSFALFFLSIIMSSALLYIIVAVLASVIGFLYTFLINDIAHIGKKHHQLALVVIPSLALVNLVLIIFLSNKMISDLGIENAQHNPLFLGLFFVLFFLLPSIIETVVKK